MAKEDENEPGKGKEDENEPGKGKEDENEPGKGADAEAEAAKWKTLARKHERQAKENAEAAKKLKELEEADKSELEKAVSKAAEATKRAEEAELNALRLEVAGEKGLTPAQAKRLVGTTKEDLESDADELLESFGGGSKGDEEEKGDKKPPARKPNERLKPGGQNDDVGDKETNVSEIVSKIPRL